MKKVLAICLVLVMLMSISATAFAAPGSFVTSPSGNPGPTVVEFYSETGDCEGDLVVTPYSEKETLPEDREDAIEDAYDTIAGTNDLTSLNSSLDDLAEDMGISSSNLAVSDLFDAHVSGCEVHEDHAGFHITLKADNLENFVGLLYMDENGQWVLLDNAKVSADGEHLEFTVDFLSVFAIVVDTSGSSVTAPWTGDNSMIHVYVILMVASAAALVAIVIIKNKKKKA